MTIRRETAVNNATTTTNEALDNSETDVTVADGSVFPATGDFRVRVEDEIMLATSRASDVLTVVRGVDGTSAVTHPTSSDIKAVWTSESIIDTVKQLDVIGSADGGGGESVLRPFRLLDINNVTLTASDFTWVNQASSSVADENWGGLTATIAENSGDWKLFYKAAPTPPYILTAQISWGPGLFVSSSGTTMGIGFATSVDGKFIVGANEIGDQSNGWRFTDVGTFSAAVATFNRQPDHDAQSLWVQIEDDNTDLYFRFSNDGINFFTYAKDPRTAFITAGPNRIAWVFRSTNGLTNRFMHLNSWIEE